MVKIAINGRFLTRPPTGVDRVAEELVRALATMSAAGRPLELKVLTPRGATRSLGLPGVPEIAVGRLSGHLWEQGELPFAVGDRLLLNPCNTGPLAVERAFTIIHDAQVYLAPESYSRAFRSVYRVLLPLLARRSRHVSTVSTFSRETLEAFSVVPKGKARVIANGCDHIDRVVPDASAVRDLGLEGRPFLLVIGSQSPHKNLAAVVAADAVRRRTDVPVVVAGGGNPKIFAAMDLGASDRVRFIGRISDGALRSLYGSATALLFPSRFEGFGLPPLEAMRCGCPVIASTAPAVREACADAALFVDPDHIDGWAAAMDAVVDDPALAARLSAAGRERAAVVTWAAAAEAVLRVIGAGA